MPYSFSDIDDVVKGKFVVKITGKTFEQKYLLPQAGARTETERSYLRNLGYENFDKLKPPEIMKKHIDDIVENVRKAIEDKRSNRPVLILWDGDSYNNGVINKKGEKIAPFTMLIQKLSGHRLDGDGAADAAADAAASAAGDGAASAAGDGADNYEFAYLKKVKPSPDSPPDNISDWITQLGNKQNLKLCYSYESQADAETSSILKSNTVFHLYVSCGCSEFPLSEGGIELKNLIQYITPIAILGSGFQIFEKNADNNIPDGGFEQMKADKEKLKQIRAIEDQLIRQHKEAMEKVGIMVGVGGKKKRTKRKKPKKRKSKKLKSKKYRSKRKKIKTRKKF